MKIQRKTMRGKKCAYLCVWVRVCVVYVRVRVSTKFDVCCGTIAIISIFMTMITRSTTRRVCVCLCLVYVRVRVFKCVCRKCGTIAIICIFMKMITRRTKKHIERTCFLMEDKKFS